MFEKKLALRPSSFCWRRGRCLRHGRCTTEPSSAPCRQKFSGARTHLCEHSRTCAPARHTFASAPACAKEKLAPAHMCETTCARDNLREHTCARTRARDNLHEHTCARTCARQLERAHLHGNTCARQLAKHDILFNVQKLCFLVFPRRAGVDVREPMRDPLGECRVVDVPRLLLLLCARG